MDLFVLRTPYVNRVIIKYQSQAITSCGRWHFFPLAWVKERFSCLRTTWFISYNPTPPTPHPHTPLLHSVMQKIEFSSLTSEKSYSFPKSFITASHLSNLKTQIQCHALTCILSSLNQHFLVSLFSSSRHKFR